MLCGRKANGKPAGSGRRCLHQPTLLSQRSRGLLYESLSWFTGATCPRGLWWPWGISEERPALCCPIKNEQIKSLPSCQDVFIALTGAWVHNLHPIGQKRKNHTGEIGRVTWIKAPGTWQGCVYSSWARAKDAQYVLSGWNKSCGLRTGEWLTASTSESLTVNHFPWFNHKYFLCVAPKWYCWETFMQLSREVPPQHELNTCAPQMPWAAFPGPVVYKWCPDPWSRTSSSVLPARLLGTTARWPTHPDMQSTVHTFNKSP